MSDHHPEPDGVPSHRHGADAGDSLPPRAYARAAALFRAVGDEERLRLLARLKQREWCVSELAEASSAQMSTVSQRLRVLRAEGLVTRRRDGRHLLYRLADEHVAELVAAALTHADEIDRHHADSPGRD